MSTLHDAKIARLIEEKNEVLRRELRAEALRVDQVRCFVIEEIVAQKAANSSFNSFRVTDAVRFVVFDSPEGSVPDDDNFLGKNYWGLAKERFPENAQYRAFRMLLTALVVSRFMGEPDSKYRM